jgi:hypothetical protein
MLLSGASSTLLLSACSSLERSEDLKSHNLSVQISNKTQVVNSIGLPRIIERDEEKSVEIWHYTGKPINTSYFVPLPLAVVPAGGGMSTAYYTDIGKKLINGNEPVALVLVFEKSGQLIQIVNRNSLQ